MKTDAFTELLKSNLQDDLVSLVSSEGKAPKPVCPIFLLDDVSAEDLEIYRKEGKLPW